MINKEFLDYIAKELLKGKNKEEVRQILLNNGWKDSDVEEGFLALEGKALADFTQPHKSKIPTIAILSLIFILVLIFAVGFVYLNLRKVAQKDVLEDVAEQKEFAEATLQNGSSIDSSLVAPEANSWQEYVFEDAGFATLFPSKPTLEKNQSGNTNHSTYEAKASIPGEDIRYSVDHIIDIKKNSNLSQAEAESVAMFAVKFTFKILYGNAVTFSKSEPVEGHLAEVFIVTSPKRYQGKIVSKGSTSYVISGECLYCQEVPDLERFIDGFKFVNVSENKQASTSVKVNQPEFVSGDIKVKVPNESEYTYSSFIPTGMDAYVSNAMTILYSPEGDTTKQVSVMLITKSTNKEIFDQSLSKFNLSAYIPLDGFYDIAGTQGAFFNGKPGTKKEGERFIVIPGEFATVYIRSVKSIGISQQVLDDIIKSIQL